MAITDDQAKRLRTALQNCANVLDSNQMARVWGFLAAHKYMYGGPAIDMEEVRAILEETKDG